MLHTKLVEANTMEINFILVVVILMAARCFATGIIVEKLSRTVAKEVADLKNPIDQTISNIGFSHCNDVKKIVGVSYEQVEGEEPDLNQLKLVYITPKFSTSYSMTRAAELISSLREFNPRQRLTIFVHGFTDDPTMESYRAISDALFKRGEFNVVALDGSALIRRNYLRSSTYVRFMGEKLGQFLANMTKGGLPPAQIHVIGHSLGAHIAGFAGKQYSTMTGRLVGRISGLDPAGPCFEEGPRLGQSDAEFVDVMHTDAGVFGLGGAVGHVDYYPNGGAQQPGCVLSTCSHSRAWAYYAESVTNDEAFPAVNCQSWDAFKNGACKSNTISYMGHPSSPSTRGQHFLQTSDKPPYSLGASGTRYRSDRGLVKAVQEMANKTALL